MKAIFHSKGTFSLLSALGGLISNQTRGRQNPTLLHISQSPPYIVASHLSDTQFSGLSRQTGRICNVS